MATMGHIQLIIDTDVIIDYLRRPPQLLEKAITQFHCGLSAVTLYELTSVAVKSERQHRRLQEFLQIVLVIPFDEQSAIHAADIWRNLQKQGLTIGLPDTLIAGTCLANRLPVLTNNKRHYSRI